MNQWRRSAKRLIEEMRPDLATRGREFFQRLAAGERIDEERSFEGREWLIYLRSASEKNGDIRVFVTLNLLSGERGILSDLFPPGDTFVASPDGSILF